jgi:hypothetical protein
LNERGIDQPAIVFPELTFYTNDSWPIIRGVANAKGFPILLVNRYSKGVFYVLNIPDNFGDLYDLPRPAITAIKEFLLTSFPVRIDADDRVSLFAYDNKTFIVQSYRDDDTSVAIAVHGSDAQLREVTSKALLPKRKDLTPVRQNDPHSIFEATVPPHSYRVFVVEN